MPGSQQIAPRLLRLKEAAKYASLSTWTLRNVIHRGEIPVVQYGDSAPWLIDINDLDRWITARKVTL